MPDEILTSRKNPLIAHLRALHASRSYRSECGEYLCDGIKLLEEAVKWKADVVTAVFSEDLALPPLPEGVRTVRVSRELMQYASPMEAPQGVLFTVRTPALSLPQELTGAHYLVLDGVQDPGNVGTILRTADAFCCDGVFLLPGCADAYNDKTVRATMGAIFRRPVYSASLEALTALLQRSAIPLYGTALRNDTVSLRACDLSRAAVAIGSEGKGLCAPVLDACRATIRIPMSERCESLNAAVAASVVLWEMYRP